MLCCATARGCTTAGALVLRVQRPWFSTGKRRKQFISKLREKTGRRMAVTGDCPACGGTVGTTAVQHHELAASVVTQVLVEKPSKVP